MVRVRAFAIALVCCAVATAPRAHAQQAPAANIAEARALFEQGIRYTNEQRWAEALERFQRARAIVERPSIVFNIGSSLFRLGRVREAVPELERFLSISTSDEERGDRAQATEMIATSQRNLARLALAMNVDAAVVEVDGVEIPGTGPARTITLDPGPHRVRVSAPDFDEERFDLALEPGQSSARAVTLREHPTQVHLEVVPTNATVTIDGEPTVEINVGVTPGEHRVEARAAGYQPIARRVSVRRGQRVVVGMTLAPQASRSVVQSPWFWAGITAAALGAAAGITFGVVRFPEAANAGTTGTVLMGLQHGGAEAAGAGWR